MGYNLGWLLVFFSLMAIPTGENSILVLTGANRLSVNTYLFNHTFKGIVRSKISRRYVKVDSLGETLFFTRTKSDKN